MQVIGASKFDGQWDLMPVARYCSESVSRLPALVFLPPRSRCYPCHSSTRPPRRTPREPLMDPIYLSPCLSCPPLASEWLDAVSTSLAQCLPSLPSTRHVAHATASSRINPGSSNYRAPFPQGLLTCEILIKQRRCHPRCGIVLCGKKCVRKVVGRVSFACLALADRCSPRYPCAALLTTPNLTPLPFYFFILVLCPPPPPVPPRCAVPSRAVSRRLDARTGVRDSSVSHAEERDLALHTAGESAVYCLV